MNKVLLLVVLISGIIMQSSAQHHWFPLGTSIIYDQHNQVEYPYPHRPAEWKVTDTATKKGNLCHRFMMKGASWPHMDTYAMYLYEDSGRVYWFRPKLDEFTVLYDFNKAIGESWTIKGVPVWNENDDAPPSACELTAVVREKGFDTINGFPLRTMSIEIASFSGYLGGFDGKVIEYIGNVYRPRPDPSHSCNSVSESTDFFGIRCFDHPEIGFHDFKLYTDCNYVSTVSIGEASPKQVSVQVYPNPSNGSFTVATNVALHHSSTVTKTKEESLIISIYDLPGKIIYQETVHPEDKEHFNIHINATDGLYILQLKDKEGNIYHDKIEIRN